MGTTQSRDDGGWADPDNSHMSSASSLLSHSSSSARSLSASSGAGAQRRTRRRWRRTQRRRDGRQSSPSMPSSAAAYMKSDATKERLVWSINAHRGTHFPLEMSPGFDCDFHTHGRGPELKELWDACRQVNLADNRIDGDQKIAKERFCP